MKLLNKAFLIGLASFFILLIGNIFLGGIIGLIIPGGDDFINSYFHPLYSAVILLTSVVIASTYVIVKKINVLLEKVQKK